MESNYSKYSLMFSNIIGVLIFLVVLGHLIEASPNVCNSFSGSTLNKFIYSFHMEAFIFVSGYFSKNIHQSFLYNIRNYIKPYYFLTFWVASMRVLILDAPRILFLYPLLRPYYPIHSAWYFFTLFFYRYFLQYLIKFNFLLPLSLVGYFFLPVLEMDLGYMSLGRSFSFLPFFLAGYYCKNFHIDKLRDNGIKIFTPPMVLIYILVFSFINKYYHYEFFYLKYAYSYFELSWEYGILGRFGVLLLSSIGIIFLISLMPNKEYKCLTIIGQNSLTVYFFHLLFVYIAEANSYFNGYSNFDYLKMLMYAFLATYLLAHVNSVVVWIKKRGV